MSGPLQDFRLAARLLRKSPSFTVTAILMLALGISANSTVFSWINGTLLHPVPGARKTDELVSIMRGNWNTSPSPPLSYPDYRDLRETNRSFSGILAYHHDWLTLTGGDTPERIFVANTSSNYFDVLGVKPFLGRFLRKDEEAQPGGVPHIVIGYALWKTRFEGDPSIIGRSIEIAQRNFTVVGVAPEGFIGCMPAVRTDAWLPLYANTDTGGNSWIEQRGSAWLNVIGRLRTGTTRAAATQDLEVLMHRLVAEYPDDHLGVNTITLDPMWRSPFGANVYMAASLPILMAIAAVVLLLTCANIATLSLVRFVARRRDTAIRQSLGASRFGIMRQMIFEGLLVSFGGAVLAIELTLWSSKLLSSLIPPNSSPIAVNGFVDFHVVVVVIFLAVLSSLICGALPAWQSSRVSTAEVLKDEAISVSGGKQNRYLLNSLVVAQIALSLVLCMAAGLFLRTLRNASTADPGFEEAHVLTASVSLSSAGASPGDIRAFDQKVLINLRQIPGVQYASITDWIPLSFDRSTANAYREGSVPQPHESLEVRKAEVSSGYFETLNIPILQGRPFTDDDIETSPLVAIVDQAAAAHYWAQETPIGKHLMVFGKRFTVVGLARNSKHQQVSEDPEPMIYFSILQAFGGETTIQVRTLGDPHEVAPTVERAIHQINPKVPVFDIRTLRETSQIAMVFPRLEALFATVFGLFAVILAVTGIYGVVAYRTQLRTQEIGIRLALGASRFNVLKLILLQGLRLSSAGIVLGLAVSFAVTRLLRGLLYGVSATDPITAAGVAMLLVVVAILSCYVPAARAVRIDPVTAIRAK